MTLRKQALVLRREDFPDEQSYRAMQDKMNQAAKSQAGGELSEKDAIVLADVTDAGTMASQDANAVAITGGTAVLASLGFGQSLLKFYEITTWTPILVGLSTAGDLQYGNQVGRRVRIGSAIFLTCDLRVTGINTAPAGNLVIRGMPEAMTGTAGTDRAGFAVGNCDNITFGDFLILQMRGNNNEIRLFKGVTGSGTSSVTWADVTDTTDIKIGFSGIYTTGAFP